jgi:hypothetical protein
MKNANSIPPYSVFQPSTSSASASGRSNGIRSISASIPMLNTTSARTSGPQNQ